MRRETTILWLMVSIMGTLQGLSIGDDRRRRVHKIADVRGFGFLGACRIA
jgi:hypothetical protein